MLQAYHPLQQIIVTQWGSSASVVSSTKCYSILQVENNCVDIINNGPSTRVLCLHYPSRRSVKRCLCTPVKPMNTARVARQHGPCSRVVSSGLTLNDRNNHNDSTRIMSQSDGRHCDILKSQSEHF